MKTVWPNGSSVQFYTKCLSNTGCGDIVVGGPDTACGKHIIVLGPDFVYRGDDHIFVIGNNTSLRHTNSYLVKLHTKKLKIDISGSPV